MDIKYTIKFYSYWHCGSGLSGDSYADSLVIKDNNGLPYVPGKTIKGLVRDAVSIILELRGGNIDELNEIFGSEGDIKSMLFFSSALIPLDVRSTITKNKLEKHLFKSISSTKIDASGIAEDGALRSIEVCVPCNLTGEILGVPSNNVQIIKDALKFIKRIGINRNRGLGVCDFIINE